MGVAGTSLDDWDRTFALNLRAHFLLVRRALVIMPDGGSIVFIGSAGRARAGGPPPFPLNRRAHFLLVRRALVIMPDGGSIVFIGSAAGLRPGSRIPAYDASKAGLTALGPHVAIEGGRRGMRGDV